MLCQLCKILHTVCKMWRVSVLPSLFEQVNVKKKAWVV